MAVRAVTFDALELAGSVSENLGRLWGARERV
jgi:hypothetical protein